jgi:hypothetical protein
MVLAERTNPLTDNNALFPDAFKLATESCTNELAFTLLLVMVNTCVPPLAAVVNPVAITLPTLKFNVAVLAGEAMLTDAGTTENRPPAFIITPPLGLPIDVGALPLVLIVVAPVTENGPTKVAPPSTESCPIILVA